MSKLFDAYVHSYCLDREYDKEFFDCIGDLFDTPEVQGLKIYAQHSSICRLDHITSVTYLTYLACKKAGLDYRAAARAAILHDLFYYDWHDSDMSHRPHGFRHARYALFNARLLNEDITDKEEKIILRHMWPLTVIPPSSPEGWVVTFADKYCATREMLIADRKSFGDRFRKKLDGSKTARRK